MWKEYFYSVQLMFIQQNTQTLTFERSISEEGEIDFSRSILCISGNFFVERLHFKSTFDWASVEKESIWKVRSWIWPLSPDFWPIEPEPSLKPSVNCVDYLETLCRLIVNFVANFYDQISIFWAKASHLKFDQLWPLEMQLKWEALSIDKIKLKLILLTFLSFADCEIQTTIIHAITLNDSN